MTRPRTAGTYRSGWCARPAEIPGVDGHRRCTITQCTCTCHTMNRTVR